MKIGVLVDGLIFARNPSGGIARVFLETIGEITQRTSDFHFYILCEEFIDCFSGHQHVELLVFRPWSFRPSRLCAKANLLRQLRFDENVSRLSVEVFHSTYYTLSPVKNAKTLATVFDCIDFEYPFFEPNGQSFVERQKTALALADKVVSISKTTTENVVKHYDVEPAKVQTIHFDTSSTFRPISETKQIEFKKKYTQGRPYFLFVGDTSRYKNLPTVIRAMSLVEQETDHVLVIAGSFKHGIDSWLYDLAIQGRVERRIVLIRQPSDEILCDAYGSADAFVFPSLQEGFGLPLIEAMRCGTPVVASDIKVFHEVCDKAAIYFDPHDALNLARKLLSVIEPSRRAELSYLGLARARTFSREKAARQMEQLYRDLASTTAEGTVR